MEANILPTHSSHLMNRLQQMVLALFDYDEDPENTSPLNTLRQGVELLARMAGADHLALSSEAAPL